MKKCTIIDLFEKAVEKYSTQTFLLEKTKDEFEPTSFLEVRDLVYDFGAGLVKYGIKPKENIAILSEGRNLWIIAELGLLYAGGVSIPLSVKLEEKQDLIFRLNHADVSTIIVSSRQLHKIREIKNELKFLKNIILLDPIDSYNEDEVYYQDIVKIGEDYLKENLREFLEIGKNIQNNDLATITYTSGTTADPKGVSLTHRNYTANVQQSVGLVPIPVGTRMLIILPLDHCFAHVVGFYTMLHIGGVVATVPPGKTAIEGLKNIPVAIKAVKPNIILSVPTLAKNFKKNIEQGIKSQGKIVQSLFSLALNTTIKYNKDGWNKGTNGTFVLKPLVSFFSNTIFKKIRQSLGGELWFFIGGGALLDIELQRFYYALGIPMFQGYGLSEATPVISTNSQENHILGSSGKLVKPMELKIIGTDGKECGFEEKGEIVIKGEQVMAGYWKNPTTTSETVRDGWLYTGDMGYMTEKGYLYVLGRYKSLLIASDGEKYSPESIEESYVEKIPFVQNAMLYNNQNQYTICILDIDKSSLPKGEEGLNCIQKELDKFKVSGCYAGMFPERWLPATFIVANEQFTEKNQMINSTMKMVRGRVEEVYKDRINYAYTPEGKDYKNTLNLQAIDIK